jgi:threonine synthase
MVCTACGAVADDDEPRPFVCPQRRPHDSGDSADHVLARDVDLRGCTLPEDGSSQPFERYRELLHCYRFARRAGETDAHWCERLGTLDAAVAAVDGKGFTETPCAQSDGLAAALGVAEVWVKDETGNVAGSHKARHLLGIALQLGADRSTEAPRLGIASCGNAALAAAVIARAAGLELETYVPPDADPVVLARLAELGAEIVTCERSEQAAGDPCFAKLRERVAAGVVPFTVQGTENGLCIEGGQTLFWEMLSQVPAPLDRVALQVGGGAFASAAVAAWREARTLGASGASGALPIFHPVQTTGGHPLERAWRRLADEVVRSFDLQGAGTPAADSDDRALAAWLRERWSSPTLRDELALAAARPARFMWPWEETPASVATGILDDQTYDWRAVVGGMFESGGWPVVVDDDTLLRARELGREHTGIDVDATGAAGLAGLLALASAGVLDAGEHVGVVFTGVQR